MTYEINQDDIVPQAFGFDHNLMDPILIDANELLLAYNYASSNHRGVTSLADIASAMIGP